MLSTKLLRSQAYHMKRNVVAASLRPICNVAVVPSELGGSDSSRNFYSSSPARLAPVQQKRKLASVSLDNSSSTTEGTGGGGEPSPMNPMPDFSDAQAAYETKTSAELFTAALSFQLCRIPILVRKSESMLKLSRKVVGDTVTDFVLKRTLFGHFCAGEDEQDIQPKMETLQKAGIGSILDFAAEDDGESGGGAPAEDGTVSDRVRSEEFADEIVYDMHPKVRLYDYESEAKCDRHVDIFKKCINDVRTLKSDGYAAVKVTALVNPKLLERMSRAIVEAQNLFAKLDQDGDGCITREEFENGHKLFFKDEDIKLKDMLEQLHPDENHRVDYITWSMLLTPRDLPRITAGCRELGPLAMAAPTDEEVDLIERMYERGHELAHKAKQCGTRLLIDAEQARFQPAIDNLVLEMQRSYNGTADTNHPIIYNTYQCYLKDTPTKLQTDVERSERFNYHFGAKMVRGAYMESERALADSLGYPSPIHDTLQDTHDCYNGAADFLLEHSVKTKQALEVMLATHNQESIEKAISSMNKYGIDRSQATICFGQLLGMSDNLTFNLGKHGYRAYKYVPYGEVKMVMPYLIRRANENSAVAGAAASELRMIKAELKRRMFGRGGSGGNNKNKKEATQAA